MFIVHPHKFTDRAKIKVEYVTCVLSRFYALQIFTNIQIYMFSVHFHTYILKAKKFAELPFQSKKKFWKKCVNPGVNVSRQMRVNLAFKNLRQKVRKSPHQYFATKHTVPDQ